MIFSDKVTGALGFAGSVPIGQAHLDQGKWSVEIFHKVASLKARSRREVRLLLAVHGADRVEMIHQVQAIWPAGISPPFAAFLPSASPLLARLDPIRFARAGAAPTLPTQKKLSEQSAWDHKWVAAFT